MRDVGRLLYDLAILTAAVLFYPLGVAIVAIKEKAKGGKKWQSQSNQ